jgi:polyphosphate kinase
MIRVAALKQQVEAEVHKRSDDGKLPEETLAEIFGALHGSLDRQMRCLDDQILPALERHGVRILPYDQLDNKTRGIMHKYFDERVFPVLTPLAIDQSHPFPYISNLSLSLAVELEEYSRAEPYGYFG